MSIAALSWSVAVLALVQVLQATEYQYVDTSIVENGACSKCDVKSADAADNGAGLSHLFLDLLYDDEQGDIHATVLVWVLLEDGNVDHVALTNVELQAGRVHPLVVGPQDTWSWTEDVTEIRVEVIREDP